MPSTKHINIPLPDLSPAMAYELVYWLEDLRHQVEFVYADELRSELMRRAYEESDISDDPRQF